MEEASTLTALRPDFFKRYVEMCASLICRRQGGFGSLGAPVTAIAGFELRNERRISKRINLRLVISENVEEGRCVLKVIHNHAKQRQ
jgi:hypothetical protein